MAQGIFAGLKRAMPRLLARRDNGGTEALRTAAPAPAAALPEPIPSAQAAASGTMQEHIVKPGETLSAIARLYDVHVDALRFINNIHNDDLPVGTRLLIPVRNSAM